jgi:NAD(P)-dependent dehydrogenase (short-subunit alcohol dehydrogenase family)
VGVRTTKGKSVTKRIVVVGGTSGIGLELAKAVVANGDTVVITGRDHERTAQVASSLGGSANGVALDLSQPDTIAASLSGIEGPIHGVVLTAIERDANSARDYNLERATRLTVLKLVGYTETVHALLDRLQPSVDTGIVLFGGGAKDLPYPGSTTVSTINAGVDGMTRTLALELAPIRVNALHPGIIGDSPFWAAKPDGVLDAYTSRTPGGELATMRDIVDATQFLLGNRGVSGTSLVVNRGWHLT